MPRGIINSVVISGLAGWVLLSAVVLAAPDLSEAAARGEGGVPLDRRPRVCLVLLHLELTIGIVLAQYLCGLATVTSASRMAFALRQGWRTPLLRSSPPRQPDAQDPGRRDLDGLHRLGPLHDLDSDLFDDHRGLRHLSLPLLCIPDRCLGPWRSAGRGRRWAPGISAVGIGRWPRSVWSDVSC